MLLKIKKILDYHTDYEVIQKDNDFLTVTTSLLDDSHDRIMFFIEDTGTDLLLTDDQSVFTRLSPAFSVEEMTEVVQLHPLVIFNVEVHEIQQQLSYSLALDVIRFVQFAHTLRLISHYKKEGLTSVPFCSF